MSESNHPWCRDVQRDEAVRAAEDAAAVPSIQHRDLPEQVALLWASLGDIIGRVVRLEAEMDAGQDEEADAASDEAVAHGATLSALAEARQSLAAANRGIARLTAERDAAIRERDAALYRLDGAMRGCVRLNNDRPAVRASVAEVKAERDAAKEECERLRAHVAELELAYSAECDARAQAQRELNDAMNAFGEEPVAWGVYGRGVIRDASHIRAEAVEMQDRHACDTTIVPLYAAPPPRGWLTRLERWRLGEIVKFLKSLAEATAGTTGGTLCGAYAADLDALIARSTVRVKVPQVNAAWMDFLHERDGKWIAAIRAAGGEVEG